MGARNATWVRKGKGGMRMVCEQVTEWMDAGTGEGGKWVGGSER